MSITLTLTDRPAPEDLAAVSEGLSAFNEADVGPADRRPLAVIVRDDAAIVDALAEKFAAPREVIAADVRLLLDDLAQRGALLC